MSSHIRNTKAVTRVWDACVESRLLYGIEAWGPTCSKQKWGELNKIQNDFLRNHLCIRQSVCTANLLSEFGRYPMETVALTRVIRFLKRIIKDGHNGALWSTLEMAQNTAAETKKGWLMDLAKWLKRWAIKPNQIMQIKDTIRAKYLEKEWTSLSTDQKFYKQTMTNSSTYTQQAYLDGCMPPKLRATLARYRLRSHKLGIIRARWNRVPESATYDRCKDGASDDEGHALMTCRGLENVRRAYPDVYEQEKSLQQIMTTSDVERLAKSLVDFDRAITKHEEAMAERA